MPKFVVPYHYLSSNKLSLSYYIFRVFLVEPGRTRDGPGSKPGAGESSRVGQAVVGNGELEQ